MSAISRGTSAGADTPLPPDAAPEIVTCLAAACRMSSLTPVTVTWPVLAVAPAGTIKVRFALTLKSVVTAPDAGAADTVTVTASPDLPESAAVTVDTPRASEIDAGARVSVRIGRVSPSVRVSTGPVTAAVPWSLAIVAVTVTLRPAGPW